MSETFIKSMKGLDYEPRDRTDSKGKKVRATQLPSDIIVAPKLNGVRMRWDVDNRIFRFNSGIPVGSCDHLVEQMLQTKVLKKFPVDGEAYHHDHVRYPFSYLNGKSRRKASSEETEFMQFHVFDLAIFDNPEYTKLKRLLNIAAMFNADSIGSHIKRVPYTRTTPDKVPELFQHCLNNQYEGIMISDTLALYQSGKGKWMWKFKPLHDAEFAFQGFEFTDEGRNVGTFAALILAMPDGRVFTAAGISDEEKLRLLADPPAIGDPITIKYGDVSNTGIPIFPRYKAPRYDL